MSAMWAQVEQLLDRLLTWLWTRLCERVFGPDLGSAL